MKILVTGANGFVGQALCAWLLKCGHVVLGAVRDGNATPLVDSGVPYVTVGDINSRTDWSGALPDVDAVVHLAARVHLLDRVSAEDDEAFIEVNARGTENLARQAAAIGVRRFVFLSTIKVNGETTGTEPFRETDLVAPSDAYSRSKWQAEQALWRVSNETGLETVIVRPPLVFGPGAKGNFLALLKAIARRRVLPLGAIHNKRSLVELGSLADLLERCATKPEAVGELFLAANTPPVSTTELALEMGRAIQRPARLLRVRSGWLVACARMLGAGPSIQRLTGNLEIDSGKAKRLLCWDNQQDLSKGLAATGQWFLEHELSLLSIASNERAPKSIAPDIPGNR